MEQHQHRERRFRSVLYSRDGVERYSLGGGLAAGGGGASIFFPKPVWQTGPGVPNNSFRNVPDLSIASSPDHDGYFVYTGGSLQIYGGTSMAAPTMAGIVTLLNQYLVSSGASEASRLGQYQSDAVSHGSEFASELSTDVTVGNNSVPCVIGSPDCTTGTYRISTRVRTMTKPAGWVLRTLTILSISGPARRRRLSAVVPSYRSERLSIERLTPTGAGIAGHSRSR